MDFESSAVKSDSQSNAVRADFNRNSDVYFEKRDVFSYPTPAYSFSPSAVYPEYPWGDIAAARNDVYDMVRSLLCGMGLDARRFGTSEWNPLGEIIKPGDDVVLKPNMVMHRHLKDESLGTDSVITNPAVVRAAADYCLIALKGKGSLTIGDAPLQSCDFETLVNESGYGEIVRYYQGKGIEIALKDFRLTQSRKIRKGGVTVIANSENRVGDKAGYIAVDIGKDSAHMERIGSFERFRVTNYDPGGMKTHHNHEKNEYIIPKTILDADVIINLPKPKTHRKAGFTAAMKNLVGINGHKDWLPHHTKGSKSKGGDEYLHPSFFKWLQTSAAEKADVAGLSEKPRLAYGWGLIRGGFMLASRVFRKDPYYEGSWYGNDTIWRTVCDLNRILLYSDKHGRLQQTFQRKCLQIGDMIVSGEGEGPMEPTPKNIGALIGSFNPLIFDTAVCALMGFDREKVPCVRGAYKISSYPILSYHQQAESKGIHIRSNMPEWDGVDPGSVTRAQSLNYRPSKGWLGHIELED